MRDPFVLPVEEEGLGYLFGTTDKDCWRIPAVGFNVYVSKDLEDWESPYPAFRPATDFWSDQNYWAPEFFAIKASIICLPVLRLRVFVVELKFW